MKPALLSCLVCFVCLGVGCAKPTPAPPASLEATLEALDPVLLDVDSRWHFQDPAAELGGVE
jgi:hypothetical protein